MTTARLSDLQSYIDDYLAIDASPDFPGAYNGLQVANSGQITKVAAAVDACLPTIEHAVAISADILLVHHGLFWGGTTRLTGPHYRKFKLALDNDLAIYSAHIPLDIHPVLGNNQLLAKALNLPDPKPFFTWKGIELGLRANIETERDTLVEQIEAATQSPAHLCPGGPQTARKIGIITGGAGSEIHAIAQTGIDTFITGEGPHWSYTAAEEHGINLIYAGHYATETFGVRALAAKLGQEFNIPHVFIDHPTGL